MSLRVLAVPSLIFLTWLCMLFAENEASLTDHVTPNQFSGSDTERIQAAVDTAKAKSIRVRIPKLNEAGGKVWKIDRAILLPSDITLLLDNCTLQLSDQCRDNLFRSDNVGAGISDPKWNHNIHILGIGKVTLKGAANPRSTGDAARKLTLDPAAEKKKGSWRVSYGSDAGKPDEKQTGDWRNILILMAYVKGFELSNVTIENSHAWAVSLERTHHAGLTNLHFHNPEDIQIGERTVKVFNKDGIDLRQGCKHIRINNVTGYTADDFIALSSLDTRPDAEEKNGDLDSTMVTAARWHGPEDDIEDVYISNIDCDSICRAIAIRASGDAGIHHIYIQDLTSREVLGHGGKHNALLVGGKGYGKPSEPGKIHHIIATHISASGHAPIFIEAPIADCHFMNVLYSGEDEVMRYGTGFDKNLVRNVTSLNMIKTR